MTVVAQYDMRVCSLRARTVELLECTVGACGDSNADNIFGYVSRLLAACCVAGLRCCINDIDVQLDVNEDLCCNNDKELRCMKQERKEEPSSSVQPQTYRSKTIIAAIFG